MKKGNGLRMIQTAVMLTLGAVLAAFSVEEFLVPSGIFDGGIIGLSMVADRFIPVPLGVLTFVLNMPFLFFGWKKMGHTFILKAGYAIALFSVMTRIFENTPSATDEVVLAVTFGGVLLGAGVGLVLRAGGCLDGTEVVAILLSKHTSVSTGQIILFFNCIIYAVVGAVFGLEKGMYSLLMYFVTSKTIDLVELGWDNTKSVMIITEDGKALAEQIYRELGRTVTFMKGHGYVSDESKDILYVVVTRAEIFDLRKMIREAPVSTFTTITEVSEIIGNHIRTEDILEETN